MSPGDRLSREEFFRLWEMHPEIKKAELIGGTVYMPSPVSPEHGDTAGNVAGWLAYYAAFTPGTRNSINTTSCMLDDSPQPDNSLRILREFGGKSWEEKKKLHGTPEFLVEVSKSSTSYDLHSKLELYQQAKVPEYLTVLLYEQEIRWHVLKDAAYDILPADPDGVWRSRIFPGLWLAGDALLAGEMAKVFAKQQEGLASKEHKAFVKELARRRKKR